jgi:DNA-binding HxlR family transcriptional regulator
MSLPIPGEQVRGSKTGKPIMALLDLLGRTWALGIVWQLSKGNATFRQLQQRCEQISPSLLKELKVLQLVESTPNGYQLTLTGQGLFSVISPLGEWSLQWASQIKKDDV